MQKERSQKLKNGMMLYSYKNPNVHGFFLSLYLRSGSMYESEGESGITHFLEHVAVRNVNAQMKGTLYPMLDRYGMEFNATTYSEMVQFYISGVAPVFARAIPILKSLFSPIVLSADEISAERERIKAEIREYDEKSSLATFSAQKVYGNTSLSRTITGTVGSIGKITRRRLEEYRRRVFTPENLFVYVTGGISDEDVEMLAREIGEVELYNGEIHENIAPVCENFLKREENVHLKNGDFTMVRFNFDLDLSRITSAECDILYDVLLGGYDSRLFMELSERRGLIYDVTGAIERYKNLGTLYFYYETRRENIEEAVRLTLAELRRLTEELLPEEKMMKVGYTDNGVLLLDEPRELNFTFAYDNHVMAAGYDSVAARAELYRGITPDRLREVARTVFRRQNLTLTVKGQKKKINLDILTDMLKNF